MAETNGMSRVGLYLSIATSGLLFISALGAFFYVGFTTKVNTDALIVQDKFITLLTVRIASLEDRSTKIEVSLNEIETQFCAQDIVRNLMHANDMRIVSQLWEKQFGVAFTTNNAYYPSICNRRTK